MYKREGELVDGLLPCPRGRRYWQFYDWAKDLSGALSKALAGEDGSTPDQFESPLNLFAVLAFDAAADCAAFVGEADDAARWRGTAERMRGAVRSRFWNAEKRQIETRLGSSLAPSELAQALALLANAIPEEERAGVVKKLSAPSDWTQTTLSQSLYKFEAQRSMAETVVSLVYVEMLCANLNKRRVALQWGFCYNSARLRRSDGKNENAAHADSCMT